MTDEPDPKRGDPTTTDFLCVLALWTWPLVLVGIIAVVAVFA